MPLLKRKAYNLSRPPNNLKAKDLVFQVRFTKEIFTDYEEYLKHINLYKQRVWTCKVTGKSNLTYEEALESECKATEKVQQFPREFIGPVLQLVQFSMLRLEDLVSAILKAFKDQFVPGEEVLCIKGNTTMPCKVLQVIDGEAPEAGCSYEVKLIDNDRNVDGSSIESTSSLVRKKLPFTRALVKSFIRESVKDNASRNSQTPLVVLDKLCEKFGITTTPPEELKKFFLKQEQVEEELKEEIAQPLIALMELETHSKKRPKKVEGEPEGSKGKRQKKAVDREDESKASKKQKALDTETDSQANKKQKRIDAGQVGEGEVAPSKEDKSKGKAESVVKVVPIKYPIEDTLVQPSSSEPPLTERPAWSSDFVLPMHCTGSLLMVWNFCSLFGKVIRLSPFSLEEFEKALECSDADPILLREAHHAFIKLILEDLSVLESFQGRRKRKVKVTIQSWKDDLADILELGGFEKLAVHSSTIRKGDYMQLEPSAKLDILCNLVECALNSTAVREQLDVYIEEKQAIASQKRKEELEESKKDKEAQEMLKQAQLAGTDSTDTAKNQKEEVEAREDGSSSSGADSDNEGNNSEKLYSNGLPNGTHENGDGEDATSVSARSRQLALKRKAELKQVEDLEKEKKRMEEHKKLQEIRKVKFEAVKERKLQEKKMIEMQKRQEHLEREIEKRVIRTHPLGKDRDHNRYWFFPREGRIFVEDKDMSNWGYYSAKEELEALYGSLNPKGIRERGLQRQLEKHYNKISDALQKRTKEITQRIALEDSFVRRSSRSKAGPQQTLEVTYRNKYRTS
ncbi:hypothetical protein GOP47_0004250 [Adiantum capillus-veneris]|uniref:DDT domain-containing protein n=1 Tax=Adiantum capillus-veneris TaxID=13818 RepID=A0A9D4ZPD9_ADICA|nr:hypothetical protein GOP47_0004250 [Adiantum capillus-veneris]